MDIYLLGESDIIIRTHEIDIIQLQFVFKNVLFLYYNFI